MTSIHIDRLVLHGFAPLNRARLEAALSAELARLVGAGGGVVRDAPVVQAPAIHAAPDATPEALGVQIAQSIYGGIAP